MKTPEFPRFLGVSKINFRTHLKFFLATVLDVEIRKKLCISSAYKNHFILIGSQFLKCHIFHDLIIQTILFFEQFWTILVDVVCKQGEQSYRRLS